MIATETKFFDGANVAKFTDTLSKPGSSYFRAQTQATAVNAKTDWSYNQYYNVK